MLKNLSVLCACLVAASPNAAAAAQTQGVAVAAAQPATGQNVPVAGGRSLHVMVAQSEIKSDINVSNIAVATGGGLLGGLIGAAVDSARAKKAEVLITPVRTGLVGLDTDAMAIETAKAAFANAQWNTAADFSKDSSPAGKSAYLDSTQNAETAFVEYTYDLSPTFDALRVNESIQVAARNVPAANKPEKRLQPKYLVYSRNVVSVVLLPDATKDKDANAARGISSRSDCRQSMISRNGSPGRRYRCGPIPKNMSSPVSDAAVPASRADGSSRTSSTTVSTPAGATA